MFAAGCNESIEHDNNMAFSIFGYLDPTAGTQWIRVTPIRSSLQTGPPMFGIPGSGSPSAPGSTDDTMAVAVTLERLETGETFALKHSLVFNYFNNYWTNAELRPGEAYRLSAEQPGLETSHVTVSLPQDFPTPIARISGNGNGGVDIEGVEHLAYVQTIYHIQEESGRVWVFYVPNIHNATRTSTGYEVSIRESRDRQYISDRLYNNFTILERQIFISATGDPDWPDFPNIDRLVEALPQGISNVENGVGFVAGVISKTIPYKSCYDANGDITPCGLEERIPVNMP